MLQSYKVRTFPVWFLILCVFGGVTGELFAEKSSDVLRLGVTGEFEVPEPYQSGHPVTDYLLPLVSHSLVRSPVEGQYSPGLLEELPEPRVTTTGLGYAIDFPVVRLKLRRKARWADGSPVTGWDVLYTWLQVRKNKKSAKGFSVITKVVVSQRDPKIFELTMLPKAEHTLRVLSTMHVLPRSAELSGMNSSFEVSNQKKSSKVSIPNMALYNGPYTVDSFILGEVVTFKKNPFFYGEDNRIPKIEVRLIPGKRQISDQLLTGQIDMIASNSLSNYDVQDLYRRILDDQIGVKLQQRGGMIFEQLVFQLRSPKTRSLAIRKALVFALNLNEIAAELAPSDKISRMFETLIGGARYDPEKPSMQDGYKPFEASSLLESAGWVRDRNGRLVSKKSGKPFVLRLAVNKEHRLRVSLAKILQRHWSKLEFEPK